VSSDQAQLALGVRDELLEALQISRECPPSSAYASQRVGGDGPHASTQAASLGAGQIEVSEEVSTQGPPHGGAGGVKAPETNRNEGVDVEIDQLALCEELLGGSGQVRVRG
jgi:hypothetical protein